MYHTYRLFRRIILATKAMGNIDTRYFAREWSPTEITFRARNQKEADKKADKFWKVGQFGMGSIMVREIPE